ncbi:MAG TPA: cation diffusion facilitator family transporter [Chloroflexota bacterium]
MPRSQRQPSGPFNSTGRTAIKQRYHGIRRVLLVVIATNLGIALGKGGYGLLTGSLGMVSDGLHSLLHALGSVVALIGASLAARPPDPTHPYGYERYEPLAALGIVGFMLLAIREILAEAWDRVFHQAAPVITPWSFLIMGTSVLATLGLARWEHVRGRALASSVLIADAKRAVSDVLVSLSVVGGLLAALLGVPVVDLLVALAIVGVIAWTGWTILREVSAVLVDAAVVDVERIARVVEQVPGVEGVHRVRARGGAGAVRIDLHVEVDPTMPVAQAHELTHAIVDRVKREIGGIAEVLVHVGVAPEPEHPTAE